jgi:carbon monoxide dehydrogenase subunit G
MRFTTREDIEVPVAEVFAALTDFDRFEREALRRGAEVERGGDLASPGTGRSWVVRFRHRGRDRELSTGIDTWDPPKGFSTLGRIGGFEGRMVIDLTELSPRRTRLRVDLEVKARSLTARLMLQSLKLAKASLSNRFKARFHGFARQLEQQRQAPAR